MKKFYEENKDILFEISDIFEKVNFSWVVSDLLSCYNRISLLTDSEILEYQESCYLLHWGYIPSDALNNKNLEFYKPSFYIDWLYAFWIDKRKKHTEKIFYEILTDISKNIKTTKEEEKVWKWDKIKWEKNIKSSK